MAEKSMIVIGAGIAGLSAGVYARMNGFRCTILEMHTQAGGLVTSWKRRGYTIDGCIHWLVGSAPSNGFHRLWQEIGLVQNRQFVDHDIYQIFTDRQGRSFNVYADPERLERHMLELAPQDASAIHEFTDGMRFAMGFNPPLGEKNGLMNTLEMARFMLYLLPRMKTFQKWVKTTPADLAPRFSDPLLRRGIKEMCPENFSLFFHFATIAWMQRKEAGYPIGGSLPLIRAVEQRYLGLGGEVRYGARVEKILVEDGRAVGVRLADSSELRADRVISAADGHATIFDMLDGQYIDNSIRAMYDTWPTLPGLIFVGVGVNRSFENEPPTVLGASFELAEPVRIGDALRSSLCAHYYNFDPGLAPAGKTVLTLAIDSRIDYWRTLHADPGAYEAEKKLVGDTVVDCLEQRWPGIAAQVEVVDVSTPLTFERYTGNWQGSFEGWVITPQNGMAQVSKTLPGLANFHMIGQWVQPGGGLPAGVRTARQALQRICKEEGRKFTTSIP